MGKVIEIKPVVHDTGVLSEKTEKVLRSLGIPENMRNELCAYAQELDSRWPVPSEIGIKIPMPNDLAEDQCAKINAAIHVAFGGLDRQISEGKGKFIVLLVKDRLDKLLNPGA